MDSAGAEVLSGRSFLSLDLVIAMTQERGFQDVGSCTETVRHISSGASKPSFHFLLGSFIFDNFHFISGPKIVYFLEHLYL